MTTTELLMSPLDSLPHSDSIRFRFRLGLPVRSLVARRIMMIGQVTLVTG